MYGSQAVVCVNSVKRCSCVVRVNLAKGSMALREFVTLDPVALASFCESTRSRSFPLRHRASVWFSTWFCFALSVFLRVGPLSEPADDQRSNQPVPGLQRDLMVSLCESFEVSVALKPGDDA